MTDTPISSGTVSSSAQFASEISGAFDSGFEFVGTISVVLQQQEAQT